MNPNRTPKVRLARSDGSEAATALLVTAGSEPTSGRQPICKIGETAGNVNEAIGSERYIAVVNLIRQARWVSVQNSAKPDTRTDCVCDWGWDRSQGAGIITGEALHGLRVSAIARCQEEVQGIG